MFQQKKKIIKIIFCQKVTSYFKTPTALPKDKNSFDLFSCLALNFFKFVSVFYLFVFNVQCGKGLAKFYRPKMCEVVLSIYSHVGILLPFPTSSCIIPHASLLRTQAHCLLPVPWPYLIPSCHWSVALTLLLVWNVPPNPHTILPIYSYLSFTYQFKYHFIQKTSMNHAPQYHFYTHPI